MTQSDAVVISELSANPSVVLVIEDEPDLRKVVCLVLEDEGFVVEAASDGLQGLEMAARLQPAVIVLDMGLPRLSGEEVAAELRTMFTEPPAIVVMSAAGTVAERAQRIGAVGYVAKPFDLDDLAAAVHRAIRSV